jgi:hypothetical protein
MNSRPRFLPPEDSDFSDPINWQLPSDFQRSVKTLPKPDKKRSQTVWSKFENQELYQLGQQLHVVRLIVLARLSLLYFRAWDKREPFAFSSSIPGFARTTVRRFLTDLERASWISIQHSKGRSFRITILKGFALISWVSR